MTWRKLCSPTTRKLTPHIDKKLPAQEKLLLSREYVTLIAKRICHPYSLFICGSTSARDGLEMVRYARPSGMRWLLLLAWLLFRPRRMLLARMALVEPPWSSGACPGSTLPDCRPAFPGLLPGSERSWLCR